MLRLLQKQEDEFLELCMHDVFGTRISAYFMTYDTDYPFALFYMQDEDEYAFSAVCIIDGNMTLCCKEDADFE